MSLVSTLDSSESSCWGGASHFVPSFSGPMEVGWLFANPRLQEWVVLHTV